MRCFWRPLALPEDMFFSNGVCNMAPMNMREPIAVVGVGCRLPGGVSSADGYWRLLCDGVDATCEVPNGRWPDMEALCASGAISTRRGGFLADVDPFEFDAAFFGISPREALAMDPQQRFLLEVAWEALEDAGLPPRSLAGGRTGVFVGMCASDYAEAKDPRDVYSGTGNYFSVAAGRIAYVFDFRGPAMAVDTACSSSLVAVHLACQSLRLGECNVALAGGVNLILSASNTVYFSALKTMAPDGRCKTFDASADGYARGEGCVVLVLKRLSDAVATGDDVLGVIRGSAVNQDGRSNGLTAPNGLAQRDVLRDALAAAGLEASDVAAVEAHGTGTPLGDPIEMDALAAALGEGRRRPLVVGSVKTNFGHLEGAAGLAGLLKMLLAVRHGAIPAHLHFQEPNPDIAWDEMPVVVPTRTMAWPPGRRIGGVSSFGLSGTNAHVIVEEPPATERARADRTESQDRGGHLLLLSAASDAALRAQARSVRDAVAEPENDLADLSGTACARRAHLAHRLAVAGADREAWLEGLDAYLAGQPLANVAAGHHPTGAPQLAFVFPGQGGQWRGMGQRLLGEPVFRGVILRCDAIVRERAGWSLLSELSPDSAEGRIDATEITQPATFALQAALTALLAAWGITPDAIVGHSFGEIAAAHAAGAFDLETGMRIALERGRVMKDSVGSGRMAMLELSVAEVERTVEGLGTTVWITGINGPKSVIVAGDGDVLAAVVRDLEARGIFARMLWGECASHSPRMAPYARDLAASLAGMDARAPDVFLVSTVTGMPYARGDLEPAYWARNLTEPVQFAGAVDRLARAGCELFLELGPHPQLTNAMRDGLAAGRHRGTVTGSLRRDAHDRIELLSALGALYAAGCERPWERLVPKGRKVQLPRYPWQRERYWQGRVPAAHETTTVHPLLGRCQQVDGSSYRWCHTPTAEGLLGDHRIHGEPVMAGAVYVEMALSAAKALFGDMPCSVENLQLQTVFVPPRRLEAVAERQTSGDFVLRFCSRDAERETARAAIEHASARLVRREGPFPAPTCEAIEAIRSRCPEPIGQADWLAFIEGVGVKLQRGFICLEALWGGDDEVLARVDIPDALTSEARGFRLYPALIEAAVECLAVACLYHRPELAVPVAIDSIRLHRTTGFKAWAHAVVRSQNGSLGGDCMLLDDNGEIALELRGVRLRPIEHPSPVAEWLYDTAWEAQPLPAVQPVGRAASAGRWLIFADHHGRGNALRAAFAQRGESCVMVYPGDAYAPIEPDTYRICPTRPEDFRRLRSEAFPGECRGIVHLWSLDAPLPEDVTTRSLETAMDLGCISALHLVQAWSGGPQRPRLWFVTSGAVAVGDSRVQLAQSPLWGFGRVLALEHPELPCSRVDLDPRSPLDAHPLLDELMANDRAEDQIAYRNGGRYVARLARSRLPATEPGAPAFRADATYLITGGTGGLGLASARWMVDRGAKHIALVARGRMSAPASVLEDLRRRAVVNIVHADLAVAEQVATALAEIQANMPPLRGIVHAAGTLRDATIDRLDAAAFRSVLPAKMVGAWHLHEATCHLELDFFTLFSSAASLMGSAGQANYAAANAFLDALAHHRRALGLQGSSINWGAWAEVGMVASRVEDGALAPTAGRTLSVRQGLQALDALLRARPVQIGVLPFDVGAWAATMPVLAQIPMFRGLLASDTPSELRTRLLAAPRTGRAVLAPFVTASVARILKLPASKLVADTPIHHFGLDSLTAMELKNAIFVELGIAINTITLLRGCSLDDLVEELFAHFLLDHVEALSHEDAEALLGELS